MDFIFVSMAHCSINTLSLAKTLTYGLELLDLGLEVLDLLGQVAQ